MSKILAGGGAVADESDGARLVRIGAWLLLALGAAAQIIHFGGGRSLWLDEAFVALNILYLTPAELTRHLDYDQVAPVGWLLAEKLFAGLGVAVEYKLRLVSLLAGLGTLLVFHRLASRLTFGAGLLCAVALMSFSWPIVRYAAEVKPYIVDVLFTCLILAAGHHMLAADRPRRVEWAGFAVLGCIAPLFSFPSVYLLFGAGAAVTLRYAWARRWTPAVTAAAISVLWLVAFALIYILVSAPQAAGTTVKTGSSATFFESGYYAPFPPRSLADLKWYVAAPKKIVEYLFGPLPLALLVLMALGVVDLVRRRPWTACLLILPIVGTVIGAALRAYPVFERLTLFLLPILILLAGVGLASIARSQVPGRVALLVVFAIVAPGAITLGKDVFRRPSFAKQEVRPVLAALAAQLRPGDRIYVAARASPAYTLYRGDAGLGGKPWVRGRTKGEWPCIIPELPAAGAASTWVLYAKYDDEAWSMAGADAAWASRGLVAQPVVAAQARNIWLYRVRTSPANALAAVAVAPAPDCRSRLYRGDRTAARSGKMPIEPGANR